MIPFDFVYCRPDSPREAADAFRQLRSEGRSPVYYAGGSEIITLCRAGAIRPGAVIDVKGIPACTAFEMTGRSLHLGAACTLEQIKRSGLFPLLGLAGGRIADHTNQCRITLGGNLCGTIIYREAALPLLLSDARVTLYGPDGGRTLPLRSVFSDRLRTEPGELALGFDVPGWALGAQYAHIKKTANEKIDYPLVSVAALRKDGYIRAAFSGVCGLPFCSAPIESALNDRSLSPAARAEAAAGLLPAPAVEDASGSGAYRRFVMRDTLQTLLEDWENDSI